MAVRDVADVPCRSALEPFYRNEQYIGWPLPAPPLNLASHSAQLTCRECACSTVGLQRSRRDRGVVTLSRLPIAFEVTRLTLDGHGHGREAARKADQEDGCQGATAEGQPESHLRFHA